MSFDTIRAFLSFMQTDNTIKEQVVNAQTADDVARIAAKHGYEFSGDALLRFSGQKVDKVTVNKNNLPGGDYN
jgi:predicted ribosomally synthesized peptide with nif11-like leader